MELLIGIVRGNHSAGEFLPPAHTLAKEKNVSVSTVRRTLSVLNSIGAVKSVNGIGTRVLIPEQMEGYCDFTQPIIRSRLLDFVQSLQTLTFSCKDAAQITIASMDSTTAKQFKERLCLLRRLQNFEMAGFAVLESISYFAPYQTIRTVYAELFQQLLWGYPLRSIYKKPCDFEDFYRPFLDVLLGCLEQSDAAGFSAKMDEFMVRDLENAIKLLGKAGVKEAKVFDQSMNE